MYIDSAYGLTQFRIYSHQSRTVFSVLFLVWFEHPNSYTSHMNVIASDIAKIKHSFILSAIFPSSMVIQCSIPICVNFTQQSGLRMSASMICVWSQEENEVKKKNHTEIIKRHTKPSSQHTHTHRWMDHLKFSRCENGAGFSEAWWLASFFAFHPSHHSIQCWYCCNKCHGSETEMKLFISFHGHKTRCNFHVSHLLLRFARMCHIENGNFLSRTTHTHTHIWKQTREKLNTKLQNQMGKRHLFCLHVEETERKIKVIQSKIYSSLVVSNEFRWKMKTTHILQGGMYTNYTLNVCWYNGDAFENLIWQINDLSTQSATCYSRLFHVVFALAFRSYFRLWIEQQRKEDGENILKRFISQHVWFIR